MGLCVSPDIFIEAPARPEEGVAATLVSSSLRVLVFPSTSGFEKDGGVGAGFEKDGEVGV